MNYPAKYVLVAFCLALFVTTAQAKDRSPVRFGISPVVLDNQAQTIKSMRVYLEGKMHRPVQFIQRSRYRDLLDLVKQNVVDFAWLCTNPYVVSEETLHLVAVPVFKGKPMYRAYLIAPADRPEINSLEDLRDEVFAFADPDSNSGYLSVVRNLEKIGETPDSFFRRSFFTWSVNLKSWPWCWVTPIHLMQPRI